MIQMQKSSHILIKGFSKLHLLVMHETKYTISHTIFNDSGNSIAFNIMFPVQYILPKLIHYLHFWHHYQWMIIIIRMWDKGHLLVILSHTKLAKYTIFVGYKESTLNSLVSLLKTGAMDAIYQRNIEDSYNES